MCGCQACHGHTEGGAAHVVLANGMAEFDGSRIATVFAADSHFQITAGFPSILDRFAHESAHAILQAIREAKRCAETGEAETILFGLTGTGYFDMVAYDKYNHGEMENHIPSDEELEAGFATIPHIEGIQ